MPAGQPFTALCRASVRPGGRADLHLHTTYSDGTYKPEEIIDLARRSGLAAVAVTDHDTVAGIAPARRAAAGSGVEVIAGVEITAEYLDRELHLLGYFVRPNDPALAAALERLREHRTVRFRDTLERLRRRGLLPGDEPVPADASLGRRHLAARLVQAGRVRTVHEAFRRYLGDRSELVVPKLRLPVAEAIELVRAAGGVASWAHPFYDDTRGDLGRLHGLGLQAVEVEYPTHRPSWARQLRAWAGELGLAVTGGSDCHGPGKRPPGSRSVTAAELTNLRQLAR